MNDNDDNDEYNNNDTISICDECNDSHECYHCHDKGSVLTERYYCRDCHNDLNYKLWCVHCKDYTSGIIKKPWIKICECNDPTMMIQQDIVDPNIEQKSLKRKFVKIGECDECDNKGYVIRERHYCPNCHHELSYNVYCYHCHIHVNAKIEKYSQLCNKCDNPIIIQPNLHDTVCEL